MVQKFTYTENKLMGLTVPNLRALIQKHNYVNSIRGFWKMKKKELVTELIKQGTKKTRKNPPLYGKGKSVKQGATEDFEKTYGKIKPEKKKKKPKKEEPTFIELPKRVRRKPARYREI